MARLTKLTKDEVDTDTRDKLIGPIEYHFAIRELRIAVQNVPPFTETLTERLKRASRNPIKPKSPISPPGPAPRCI